MITEITISAEEYKKETGNETVEETITVSRKLISGKIVTYYPQTERYPYPCQARYNRAEIKIDGDGEYPHNPVVEKIKGKLADLQCLPEDHAEHCDSTKQLFESL